MAYKTYITEAIVCGSKASHTADRSFLLFTKEAGMLYAMARSVREERSKQRYALQEFSHIRTTLVRGKSGWRIAGVETIENFYAHARTREARACMRAVLLLVRRVMQGEVAHSEIFTDVVHGLHRASQGDTDMLVPVVSLRILGALGYVSPNKAYDVVLSAPSITAACAACVGDTVLACEIAIGRALTESHL